MSNTHIEIAKALRAQAAALLATADALDAGAVPSHEDELVWIGDLAERKGIERLIHGGRLRAVKIGRKVFVSKRELLSLLEAKGPPRATPAAAVYDFRQAISARGGR